jgi:hypothetical protein
MWKMLRLRQREHLDTAIDCAVAAGTCLPLEFGHSADGTGRIPNVLHHSAQDCEAPSYPGCVRPNIPPDAADAVEKRAAGAVWAWRSRGKCFFVMPTEGNLSVITKSIRSAFPAGD